MDRTRPKRFWTKQRIFLIIGGLLLVSFVAYQFFGADHRRKLNVEKDKLTLSKVTVGAFDEFIVVTGVVQPL
ncbi:MAG: efflux transporter periplasmic adaptor subunit, partial [Runella slithyformis]